MLAAPPALAQQWPKPSQRRAINYLLFREARRRICPKAQNILRRTFLIRISILEVFFPKCITAWPVVRTAMQTGLPFHASIAASKGAIEGFTRSLAAVFAPGIRFNAIAPSLTGSPPAQRRRQTRRRCPAQPHEVLGHAKRHRPGRPLAATMILCCLQQTQLYLS